MWPYQYCLFYIFSIGLTRTIMETDNIEAYFFMQVVWSTKKISAVAFE